MNLCADIRIRKDRFGFVALKLAGLLALASCQTHPAPENPPKPTGAIEPAAPATQAPPTKAPPIEAPPIEAPRAEAPPAAPKPVPFQPAPPALRATPAAPARTTSATPAPATPAAAAASAPKPALNPAPKPASLDLNSLEQRLKDTRAIGVFTKLSLKNQVDDLLSELRTFHAGSSKTLQPVLRQKYDLLIMKVLSLLQDGDPPLASAIAGSREAIWQILMDPNKFAKI